MCTRGPDLLQQACLGRSFDCAEDANSNFAAGQQIANLKAVEYRQGARLTVPEWTFDFVELLAFSRGFECMRDSVVSTGHHAAGRSATLTVSGFHDMVALMLLVRSGKV